MNCIYFYNKCNVKENYGKMYYDTANFFSDSQKIPEVIVVAPEARRKSWHCWQMIKMDIFRSSKRKEAIGLDAEKSDSGIDEIEEDIQCDVKDNTNEAEEIIEEEIECVTEDDEGKLCCDPPTKSCQTCPMLGVTNDDDDGLSD
jgi:hypothetical protein